MPSCGVAKTRDVMRAIYRHFADTGTRPDFSQLADVAGSEDEARRALAALAADHIVVLDDADPDIIEMALPFSGIPRPHRVTVEAIDYAANCAWDTFGILGALAVARDRPVEGRITSTCADCDEPIVIDVEDGRVRGDAVVHFVVPARQWWDDIRFT